MKHLFVMLARALVAAAAWLIGRMLAVASLCCIAITEQYAHHKRAPLNSGHTQQ